MSFHRDLLRVSGLKNLETRVQSSRRRVSFIVGHGTSIVYTTMKRKTVSKRAGGQRFLDRQESFVGLGPGANFDETIMTQGRNGTTGNWAIMRGDQVARNTESR